MKNVIILLSFFSKRDDIEQEYYHQSIEFITPYEMINFLGYGKFFFCEKYNFCSVLKTINLPFSTVQFTGDLRSVKNDIGEDF